MFSPYNDELSYIDENGHIQPITTIFRYMFCNEDNTPMFQVITSFIFGVLLSTWTSGIFFLTIFIVIYEILYYIYTHGNSKYYNLFVRTGVIYSSLFGYILGRSVCRDEILYTGT